MKNKVYKCCENCKFSKEYPPHRNIVNESWNYLHCKLKHKYVNDYSRIRALMCKYFEDKEETKEVKNND